MPLEIMDAQDGAGGQKVVEIVKDYFIELRKAGFTIWALGHTKLKSIKEKSALDDGYQALASVMTSNYEAIFADVFDCVLTGYIEKNLEEKVVGKVKDRDGNETDKTVKYATTAERRLYLRGTDFVEAGCRFKTGTVPEYIIFDKSNMAKDFINVLEEGMKASATTGIAKEKPKSQPVTEDDIEDDTDTSTELDMTINEEENTTLMKDIVKHFKVADDEVKSQAKEIAKKYGTDKINKTLPTAALKEILDFLA